jgi:hypothetical protein
MAKLLLLGLALIVLLLGLGCSSRVRQSASQLAEPQGDGLNALLTQLQSDDWRQRADAVEKVQGNPEELGSVQVKRALFDVFDKENQIIKASLQDGDGITNKPGFGEDYTEYYYGPLSDTIDKITDPSDPATLDSLARSSYNPDSNFAKKLAGYGELVIPTMLKVTNSDLPEERQRAIAVLGLVLEKDQKEPGNVRAELRDLIRQAIEKAVSDDNFGVRLQAVRSLKATGKIDSLKILRQVIKAEPASVPVGGGKLKHNPIRAEAMKAIQAINSNPARKESLNKE